MPRLDESLFASSWMREHARRTADSIECMISRAESRDAAPAPYALIRSKRRRTS